MSKTPEQKARHAAYMREYKKKYLAIPENKAKHLANTRRWQAKQASLHPGKKAGWHRENRYGLTQSQFEMIFAAQGGVCAICRHANKDGRALVVDHDHGTGKVRGLLCHACNAGIGQLKDSPEVLVAASNYLGGTDDYPLVWGG